MAKTKASTDHIIIREGLTLGEAEKQAIERITDEHDALGVAVGMLTEIKSGNNYGTFEYLTLLNRMNYFNEKLLFAAVKAHALKNYNHGGWDIVIECWEIDDYREHIAGETTVAGAIEACRERLAIHDDIRRDIQSEAF